MRGAVGNRDCNQLSVVVFVTHQHDLAHGLYVADLPLALFVRAKRDADGKRTYKVTEGEPLPTSYGEDSYRKIFGQRLDTATITSAN